jgi:copper(I)-binding protein
MTRAGFVLILLLLAACAERAGPPVVVNNVVVTAVTRDMPMAAAYLDISNRSGEAIRITRVSSPNYESVEMHETAIEDGIARMRKLDVVEIPDDETVSFVRGGRHLMLMRPLDDAANITLNFYQQDLLIVSISAGFTRLTE